MIILVLLIRSNNNSLIYRRYCSNFFNNYIIFSIVSTIAYYLNERNKTNRIKLKKLIWVLNFDRLTFYFYNYSFSYTIFIIVSCYDILVHIVCTFQRMFYIFPFFRPFCHTPLHRHHTCQHTCYTFVLRIRSLLTSS